jgi:hypothetical protein
MRSLEKTNSFYLLFFYFFTAILFSACGGGGSDPVVPSTSLSSLALNTVESSLKISETFQLNVTGTYSDGSSHNLTSLVTWESSNSDVASISASGVVLAVSLGTTSVTASLDGLSKVLQVTVLPSLDSLSVTDISSSLKVSVPFQLTLTGTYSDGSTQDLSSLVAWSVADSLVFEVSSGGLITPLSAGNSSVTATYQGLSIQQNILVKALTDLSISPTSVILGIASSQQLSVMGRYSDNSVEVFDSLVEWVSSGEDVASVSNSGQVLGISAGTVSITANFGVLNSSLSMTVSPATLKSIAISSPITQIVSGLTATFSAKGIYSDGTEQDLSQQVAWSVSDSVKASINSDTGLLTAIQIGRFSVIASKEGQTGSFVISVSPASLTGIAINPSNISLAKGSSKPVNVTANFSDNTKLDVSEQVEWVSSNSQTAIIKDGAFNVQALLEGSITLSAELLGQQADLLVNVTNVELVSLSLSPVNASIPLGQSQQYYAQGTFTDGTVQDLTSEVTWLSSNEDQALISNTESLSGLAESIALGSTTLSAVLGGIQQDTLLTIGNAVLSSLKIEPADQEVAKGTDAYIKAFGYFTDGSLIDLTSKVIWSSSNSSSVSMLSTINGTALSLNNGSALISAALDGLSGLGEITVTDATLQSISISATQTTMPDGITQTLVATGTYSDMSTKNLSRQVSWQSDDVLKATVSNNVVEPGLLRAISPGQVTISASLGSVSDQINIDVTSAALTSIQINNANSQINVTSSLSLKAIANFSDSSTQDVSSQVNWLSSDVNIASIGNTQFNKGIVIALSAGMINISASLQGVNSLSVPIEVTLNPNLPKAINLSVQPNIILNDNDDAAQVTLVLVPTTDSGVIEDGTPVTLTITEGNTNRNVNLVTTNGTVSYSLQSSYDGFISLSAIAGDYSVSSGVLSTDSLSDALLGTGLTRDLVYENNTLKEGSTFAFPIRNLTNRVFIINQVNVGYLDPNNNDAFVNFPESPLTEIESLSDGALTAGEFYFIGYQLNNDIEANIYVVSFLITDEKSNLSFRLRATFDFEE